MTRFPRDASLEIGLRLFSCYWGFLTLWTVDFTTSRFGLWEKRLGVDGLEIPVSLAAISLGLLGLVGLLLRNRWMRHTAVIAAGVFWAMIAASLVGSSGSPINTGVITYSGFAIANLACSFIVRRTG